MRSTRRRQRLPDLLARPEAVRAVCEELRSRMPGVIPNSEKHLVRFLYAVRHVERRPATDTKRGRPSRWRREDLVSAAGIMRAVLQRETSGRVSLNSFVGQYVPILNYPADVIVALAAGQINLHEAAQLARLTPDRLECDAERARSVRDELLRSHVLDRGSQNRLRARVKDILGETDGVTGEQMTAVVHKVDELLEIDPGDKRHLFYEEMKRLFYAMREIEPEDVDDESLDQFMSAADQLSNAIYKIESKRRQREKGARRLPV
jgi:hypothetical protein